MTDLVPLAPAEVAASVQSGFDAAIDAWLRAQPSEHTRRSYRYAMNLWRDWLARRGRLLADLPGPGYRGPRRVDADEWRDHLLAQDMRAKSVDTRLIAIRSFYAHLHQEGALEVNPIRGVELLNPAAGAGRVVRVERSAWEAAQAAASMRGENLTRQVNLFLRRYARPRRSGVG